ncbi:MAG: bifunctional hydroxymethylpyrimidine kinase/phosphomethylpyrimidine kinase [Gammaproteobacteria bacterium]
MSQSRPSILFVSGHDPGGGAGIQADIETALSLGGHALTLISAHTVQDTRDVASVRAADLALLREQAALLLADSTIRAIKVGLLGDAEQVPFVLELAERSGAPLVVDPVLRAGGGAELASASLVEAVKRALPRIELLTPNAAEARRLAGAGDLQACGAALVAAGARNVLITGGDEPANDRDDAVINRWYRKDGAPRAFSWPRLPGTFHGAGCTLAAAIATLLAQGLPMGAALADAQAWVHGALERGFAPGRGRDIPGRRP